MPRPAEPRDAKGTLASRRTGAAIPSLVETARSLKTLRALTSSDDGECGSARGALDTAVGALQRQPPMPSKRVTTRRSWQKR